MFWSLLCLLLMLLRFDDVVVDIVADAVVIAIHAVVDVDIDADAW